MLGILSGLASSLFCARDLRRGHPLLRAFHMYTLDVVLSLLAREGTEGVGVPPLFGDVTKTHAR